MWATHIFAEGSLQPAEPAQVLMKQIPSTQAFSLCITTRPVNSRWVSAGRDCSIPEHWAIIIITGVAPTAGEGELIRKKKKVCSAGSSLFSGEQRADE